MAKKDFYEILGVVETASVDEIKKAYRKLAKEYHPDAHPNDKEAEERFKQISEAYGVLKDPDKRAKYDQMRRLGAFDGAGQGGYNFGDFDFSDLSSIFGSGRARSGSRRFSFDDFGGLGGLGDIFSQFFDRSDTPGRGASSQSQQDIHVELEVSFELAVRGGRQNFTLSKDDHCPSCKGKGGSNVRSCPNCGGSGRMVSGQGFFSISRPCPRCYGRGTIVENVCPSCHGSGIIKGNKSYSVKIPTGAHSGQKLRLKGEGMPSSTGQSKGDLIITLKVRKHGFLNISGNDVFCDVVLKKAIAKKGTKIRVKTISGKKAELKIPPGTKDGALFRLRGLGITSGEKQGCQYVRIKIEK